jgi:hypothetical protein
MEQMTSYTIGLSPIIGIGFMGHDLTIHDDNDVPIAFIEYRAIVIAFIVISFKTFKEL